MLGLLPWLTAALGLGVIVSACLRVVLPTCGEEEAILSRRADLAPGADSAQLRPDEVLLANSSRYRVKRSGRFLRVPYLAQVHRLDLRPLEVSFLAPYVLCRGDAPLSLRVDAVVAPSEDPQVLGEHLDVHLRGQDYLRSLSESLLERHLRRTLAGLEVAHVQRHSASLAEQVLEAARADLSACGLTLRSVSLRPLSSGPLLAPAAMPARWGQPGAMPDHIAREPRSA
jgi:uncharacterized membrane protein YqiK